MSLNLGNVVIEAAQSLRQDPNFAVLRAGLGDLVQAKINAAIDTPVEQRHDATAYARALRDMWVALEAATLAVRQNAVPVPKIKLRPEMQKDAPIV